MKDKGENQANIDRAGRSDDRITDLEERILQMIVGRMSDGEIAFALDISDLELKAARRTLFGKLDVTDSSAAREMALKRRMIRTEL